MSSYPAIPHDQNSANRKQHYLLNTMKPPKACHECRRTKRKCTRISGRVGDSCDQCRATLADLRAVSHLLSNLPHAEPPRSFHLGPEYARERKSWLDQLGGWLMPALPAMRAATIAVALTLGGLTAYRVAMGRGAPAPALRESQTGADLGVPGCSRRWRLDGPPGGRHQPPRGARATRPKP